MKSESLPLKTITNDLDFSKETSYYSMKRLKKRYFNVACKQIIRKTMWSL